MHFDGTGFQYVWSNWPQFNADASLNLGFWSLFFGAMFGREFLQTKRYHKIADKLFLAIMAISSGMFFVSGFLDTQVLKWGMVLLAPFTYLWFLVAGLIAARKRFKEVRFYVIAWAGVFLSSLAFMARELLGIELSEQLQWDSMRVVMVADAAFMGLGLLDRFNQVRIASQENLKARLREAKQNLQLTQRLSDLENKFSEVNKLAESRDEQMMNTVHDLRQPLHALRLKVHDMMQGNSSGSDDFDSVKQTFSYLEGLVSEQLASTSGNIAIRDESEDLPGNSNVLSTREILAGVYDMFEGDAREKGLSLVHTNPDADIELDFDQLSLMRIVSNLVSNAIKYTDTGEVCFGLARIGKEVGLSVADTGVGMSQKAFEQAMKRNVRLEDGAKRAAGNGYGLSIVGELAEEHGLAISMVEGRDKGTEIEVLFPQNMVHGRPNLAAAAA